MTNVRKKRTAGFLLYPEFEILDVCGPLEMFGNLGGLLEVMVVAEHKGPVDSAQGAAMVAEHDFDSCPLLDLVIVPGGIGSRKQVENTRLLDWLLLQADTAEIMCSVCTGSGILAKAGLLDGFRATSNKMAFAWAMRQGPGVNWVRKARWVDEGRRATSSGVTAGIDMSLALIARLYGIATAERIATATEHVWQRDPEEDPFWQTELGEPT